MEEEWRDIPDYKGYQVSDMGRIRSKRRCGNTRGIQNAEWKILKPWLTSKQSKGSLPHVMISLCKDAKVVKLTVAYLVLLTFVSDRPTDMVVCHYNDNRHDNRLENLRWGTRYDNERDADRNNTRSHGVDNWISKLTDQDVIEILKAYQNGTSQQELADNYNARRTAIGDVVNRRTWKHVILDGYVKPQKHNDRFSSDIFHSKLTQAIANEIRKKYNETHTLYSELATEYGVTTTTIYRIINNLSWKEQP